METGILLLFLSDYKEKSENESKFIFENANQYTGKQTNEAPCKYLLTKAVQDGMHIKRIICILTKEVKSIPVDGDKTAYDLFKERIIEFYGNDDLEFCPVDYSYEEISFKDSAYRGNDALSVYRGLKDILLECAGSKVYIDFTGGMRNVAFLMTTVVRYMEIISIKCGAIVYAMYGSPGKLIDITYIYEIYRLINAVDIFTSSGNAEELNNFSDDYQLKEAQNLMSSIISLADDISLCQIENIEERFKSVSEALESLSTYTEQNRLFIQMIQLLIPTIKHKLYIDEQISVPNIIRWCVDNNLIQQAVTLYVEKLPKYYYEQNILPQEDNYALKNEASRFYEEFYERYYYGQIKDPYETRFKVLLKKVAEDNAQKFSARAYEGTEYYKDYQKALTRLESIFKHRYLKKDKNFKIYGEEIKETQFTRFVNSVINGQPMYMHFLLCNNEAVYQETKGKSRNERGTYIKKLKAAEEVEMLPERVSKGKLNNKSLAKIMRYYLAVKIVRNNLNHANFIGDASQNLDNSMNETIEGLAGLGISVKMNAHAIKRLVIDGLEIIADVSAE